jgi:L-iditol 2-dehydrogenase
VAVGDIPVDRQLVLGHECSGHVMHDPSGRFSAGAHVAVNPLRPNFGFIGLDCDGALQEYIQIEPTQLIAADAVPTRLAAYLEPVAASMAVLKARIDPTQKGVIYHANRISHLTYLILESLGYDIEWVKSDPRWSVPDQYDYAIETQFHEKSILDTMHALKPGGLLVVKSRQHTPTAILPNLMVTKELSMQAVNYYDFNLAMDWLRTHQELLLPLLGDVYALDNWPYAFQAALAGDAKKIFIQVGQG